MKSRISFFDKAVLRKDITRFAPLWAIYLIGGLLVIPSSLTGLMTQFAAKQLASTIAPYSTINMIYAVLCAQLLFGDLFNTRMCNALHAMPLRRETWFLTHVVSGLCFSLVPQIIGAVLEMLLLQEMWFVGLYWLLGMTLEYLFFFGLAVFCVFCVGNRLAMAVVYGIVNFAAMIVYWFVETIYEPLLYGVNISAERFQLFSPVVQMNTNSQMLIFERLDKDAPYNANTRWEFKGMGQGWEYLAICAVIGVVLLIGALLLYRRRKLECAGDFAAVKPLEPIFAVVFPLCVGCVFAMFGYSYLVFLSAGLIIGWFIGQMLLQRTVKVFKGKVFLKLGILLLALGATLLLTWIDPIGITRWLPEEDQVSVVHIGPGNQIYLGSSSVLELQGTAKIQKVIDEHSSLIAAKRKSESGMTMTIQYTMKDGQKIIRTYSVEQGTKEWNSFEKMYSIPEEILGYTDWETFASEIEVSVNGQILTGYFETKWNLDVEEMKSSLLEALKKDCEEGSLPQKFPLFKEEKEHVSCHKVVRGVHGYFSKEIFYLRVLYHECAKSIPKVVQRIKAFTVKIGALIVWLDE